MEKREIYKDNFAEYLLCLALDVGEGMLRAGGEVSRVEDTIERICHAYGAVHVEVFSIISFTSAAIRMPDGSYSSQLRRTRDTANDYSKLEKYNALSRKICSERPRLEEVECEIGEIKRTRSYHTAFMYLAHAFASGSFALFFGGSVLDGLVAFILGAFTYFIYHIMPSKANVMAKTVVSAFLSSALAMLSESVGITDSADYVIIGVIMLLVPGVAFGTAMRDLLYGDLIAGALKTLQAVLIALMIAFGYMMSFELIDSIGVQLPGIVASAPSFEKFFTPLFFIATVSSVFGSVSFAVMFKVEPRHLLYGGIGGMVTYVIYYTVEFFTGGAVLLAALISTVYTALFAEVIARFRKAPAIVFLIPGVIPTVPGGALYRTMRALLMQDWEGAFDAFLVATETALGISCGIMAVSVVSSVIVEKINKRKLVLK